MKLTLVCRVCDKVQWIKLDYKIYNTTRRYNVCKDCITSSETCVSLDEPYPSNWKF